MSRLLTICRTCNLVYLLLPILLLLLILIRGPALVLGILIIFIGIILSFLVCRKCKHFIFGEQKFRSAFHVLIVTTAVANVAGSFRYSNPPLCLVDVIHIQFVPYRRHI